MFIRLFSSPNKCWNHPSDSANQTLAKYIWLCKCTWHKRNPYVNCILYIPLVASLHLASQWRFSSEYHSLIKTLLSGDDLFSTPKPSWSFYNSDLGHLQHSSDSNHLPVPEMLWSFSYSEPLPAIPNTIMCSFHPSTSPDTSSKGCSKTSTSSKGNSETSSNFAPSDLNSTPTFSGYSQGCSGDEVAPTASDIKGHIIRVICNIKGQGWPGLMGNARHWPWSQTSIV